LHLLAQAHLALMHFKATEAVVDCCIKAKPTFADAEAAKDFREMLRIFGAKRQRGAEAISQACDALRKLADVEIYRVVMEQQAQASFAQTKSAVAAEADAFLAQSEAEVQAIYLARARANRTTAKSA
jgi:hypothetical protein